jgi:hypothetical protein
MSEKLETKTLESEVHCCWWLMCENNTSKTIEHPVLGDVPICDRCLTIVEDKELPA